MESDMARGDNPKLAMDQQTVSHLKAAMESTARADQQTVSHLRTAMEKQLTVAQIATLLGSSGTPQSGSQAAPQPSERPQQGSQSTEKK